MGENSQFYDNLGLLTISEAFFYNWSELQARVSYQKDGTDTQEAWGQVQSLSHCWRFG